jgi:hypothetical protein
MACIIERVKIEKELKKIKIGTRFGFKERLKEALKKTEMRAHQKTPLHNARYILDSMRP